MKYIIVNTFKKRSYKEYGQLLFLSGIFFLPSTLVVGILLLLPSAIIGSFFNKKPFLKDKWNYPFLTFGVLILLSSFLQNFLLRNNYSEVWDPSLSLVGLGNWLPFVWLFWAFQPFLDSAAKRRSLALVLLAGSFPVLITGFGQYFFNWNGPFQTLNGLIVWYQKPIINPGGLSGLFNNQNYAGSWLNFIWPFCIAIFFEKKNKISTKIVDFIFLISVSFATFLTYSRNAWLGLVISTIVMIRSKFFYFFLLLSLLFLIIFFGLVPIFTGNFQSYIRDILPEKLYLEFFEEGYIELDASRIEIFSSALNLIKTSPIFGIGAASFPAVFLLETTFWKGHSHNLLLELAVSYGVPATLLFFMTINIILLLSGKVILFFRQTKNSSLFDNAIWTALLFFIISQLVDIQYFDGKISIVFWILIASLKNIIVENNNEHLMTKN